ncbi:MAG: hypothetical protein MZV70_64000 [Desulfobacterales bacterium]|nr:hypothetical protein [Desulfobacterales bacterium]
MIFFTAAGRFVRCFLISCQLSLTSLDGMDLDIAKDMRMTPDHFCLNVLHDISQ